MKKLIFLLILFSCATRHPAVVTDIDPEFAPIIEKYRKHKWEKTGNFIIRRVSITFYTLDRPTLGVCYLYGSGKREILIDPDFWFSTLTSESDKEALIFHELGHCDLSREHSEPSSIMEKYFIGGVAYYMRKDYYVDELFIPVNRKDPGFSKAFKFNNEHSCGGIIHTNEKE